MDQLERRVEAIEQWRRDTVEGKLARMEEQINGIRDDMKEVRELSKKLDKLNLWLVGLLGTVVVSLLLLVLNLVTRLAA